MIFISDRVIDAVMARCDDRQYAVEISMELGDRGLLLPEDYSRKDIEEEQA